MFGVAVPKTPKKGRGYIGIIKPKAQINEITMQIFDICDFSSAFGPPRRLRGWSEIQKYIKPTRRMTAILTIETPYLRLE